MNTIENWNEMKRISINRLILLGEIEIDVNWFAYHWIKVLFIIMSEWLLCWTWFGKQSYISPESHVANNE